MDTFVVRVYRSEQDSHADSDRLRGVVEEVSTGSQATFRDTTQLLAILHHHSQPFPTEGGPDDPGQRQTR